MNMESIAAAIAAIGDLPPRPRIIVGFPLVKSDEVAYREADRLTLMGRVAFEKLRAHANAKPLDLERDQFLILCGITVEFFGERPDHERLLRELLRELTEDRHD